ncbi:MAG: aspartate--tRNA(Asn) ligase [Clostridiales bacterium]|nr:aspartate--tRNA(Asn) ligase [Clostridiales bacterium]
MMRTMIQEINEEKEVTVSGWIHRIKKLKAVVFVILKDRTGYIQLAMDPNTFGHLKLETVISATGTVVSGANKYGQFEIQVKSLSVLSEVTEDLPIKINGKTLDIGLDTMLNNRVLSLRHEQESAIFKIQAVISQSFKSFLITRDFTEIHSPKLVKEGAEGGSNVFSLDYFGDVAYLAQSPQFYKQMMVISGLERVFEVGSVFRAESHSTVRHLNEYVSMDLEMGFIESEEELMILETELLRHIFSEITHRCSKELACLEIELPIIPEVIPTMRLDEATALLNRIHDKELEGDLDPESEILIYQHMFELTGSEFLFLTHYPKKKRPMYAMPDGNETRSFDLLFRGLEITTGGLRIHHYQQLVDSMIEKGLNPVQYESYLEAFKYGVPPHGGLAIGLERLTAKILNMENIRRTTLFPRDRNRLTP